MKHLPAILMLVGIGAVLLFFYSISQIISELYKNDPTGSYLVVYFIGFVSPIIIQAKLNQLTTVESTEVNTTMGTTMGQMNGVIR
jgi:hypothetical protein